MKALAWAAAITVAEAGARRLLRNRSRGWLLAYPIVGATALIDWPARPRRGGALWVGIPLALAGYPIGCALLGHHPTGPPPDSQAVELLTLAGVVAPAEELAWGGRVESRLGIAPTALLFAAKHVAIDGRWRRALGLVLFWTGLGIVRRSLPMLALGIHVAANAGGVVVGHATGRDQF